MKFFKQVINKAIRGGLITVDPFNGYKISVQRVDRGFLTEDDLKKMMEKEFASKRLEQVRDIFVFACFTGLAYIDLANLRVDNIQKMFDGRLWIVTHYPLNIFNEIQFYRLSLYIRYLQMFSFGLHTHEISRF